jgi:hypothetical protein
METIFIKGETIMKKFVTLIQNAIEIVILSIIALLILPGALIINLLHGVSPKIVIESLWYHIQIGKEENEEES